MLVPPESRCPASFKYGPWVKHPTPSDCLTTDTSFPCGEDRKRRAWEIVTETESRQADVLSLFCYGACPSDRNGMPIATAACMANFRGKITETLIKTLGPNTSTRDAAAHALTLATALVILALQESRSIQQVQSYTTDPHLPAQCLNLTKQTADMTNFSQALTNILDSYCHLQVAIGWALPGKGLRPLQRAKAEAAKAARREVYDPDNLPPPSKDQIRTAT
jgi:hypothetical protein